MNNTLDLFFLMRSIFRHRRFIILFVILVSVGAVTYSLLADKYWKSSGTVAVSSSSSPFPGMLKGLIASYSSSLSNLAGNEEAMLQTQILESRSISEGAIRHFNLLHYFGVSKQEWQTDSLMVMDDCIGKLHKEVIKIQLDEVTGTITLSATTKDKQLSRDLVMYFFKELDKYNQIERYTKGRARREFLDKRVQQIVLQIKTESEDLAAFQQKHNIVSLEEQVTAAIATYGDLIKLKMETSTEVEFAQQFYPKENPRLQELQKRLAVINDQIEKIQNENISKYMPDFNNVNALSLQYMTRKMNLEVLSEVYKSMLPQLELARLEELNDMTSIQYIQRPTLDGLREKPKRAMICLVAFFVAFLFACFTSLIYDLLALRKDRFKDILKDC